MQSSLFKFYEHQEGTGPGRTLKDRPTTGIVPVSPTFNIHLHSESEMENATGLNKQRSNFGMTRLLNYAQINPSLNSFTIIEKLLRVPFTPLG